MTRTELCAAFYADIFHLTSPELDRLFGAEWHEPMRSLIDLGIIEPHHSGTLIRFTLLPMRLTRGAPRGLAHPSYRRVA